MKKIALALIMSFALTNCASNSKEIYLAENDTQKTRQEIEEALIKWTESFNEEDLEGAMAIFSPGIIGSYQGEPDLNYDQIKKSLAEAFADKSHHYHYDLEIDEIDTSGDLAVSWLFWHLEDNGNESKLDERSVDVWHKNSQGQWQITRFNAYPMMKRSQKLGVFHAAN